MSPPNKVICIIGGPRTGKTTLAKRMAEQLREEDTSRETHVLHTDDLLGEQWSNQSDIIADAMYDALPAFERWGGAKAPWGPEGRQPVNLIVEGCAAVRGLRKLVEGYKERSEKSYSEGLEQRDLSVEVIYLTEPKVPQNEGQARLGKGIKTIFSAMRTNLRGCKVSIR